MHQKQDSRTINHRLPLPNHNKQITVETCQLTELHSSLVTTV